MGHCDKCGIDFEYPAYITHKQATIILGFTLYTPACPWCGEPLYKKPEKTKESPKP